MAPTRRASRTANSAAHRRSRRPPVRPMFRPERSRRAARPRTCRPPRTSLSRSRQTHRCQVPPMILRTHLRVAGAAAVFMVVATTLAAAGSSSVRRPQLGSTSRTANCISMNACYTPQQLEVAYGVQPLLRRGIDGRGETVVLPELAESQLSPPQVTDLRRDFAAFDRLFHLPPPPLKVVSTFPRPAHPWLAFGEEVGDAEMVHTIAPRAALT